MLKINYRWLRRGWKFHTGLQFLISDVKLFVKFFAIFFETRCMTVIILYIHFIQSILLHRIDMKIYKNYLYWWTDLYIVAIVKKIFLNKKEYSKSLQIWIVLVVRILILSPILSGTFHLTAIAGATILVGFNFYQVTATHLKIVFPYIKFFNNPLVLSCFYTGHILHWDINGFTGHPSTMLPTMKSSLWVSCNSINLVQFIWNVKFLSKTFIFHIL